METSLCEATNVSDDDVTTMVLGHQQTSWWLYYFYWQTLLLVINMGLKSRKLSKRKQSNFQGQWINRNVTHGVLADLVCHFELRHVITELFQEITITREYETKLCVCAVRCAAADRIAPMDDITLTS